METLKSKISPDLEAVFNESFYRNGKATQRVLIQYKPATPLNEYYGDVSKTQREQYFAEEVQSNRSRTTAMRSKLQALRGKINKSFDNLGLVSAELPISMVGQLQYDEEIAYISPDRPVEMAGHVEATTGATLVRNLVSGMTLDGAGIGIAVVDSGMQTDHSLLNGRVSFK